MDMAPEPAKRNREAVLSRDDEGPRRIG